MWRFIMGESFITTISHFIYKGKLRSAVMETTVIEHRHKAKIIKDYLQKLIDEWNLYGKVQIIITDNASNMVKACDLLKINHHNCFAHTLNLTVNDGLEDASNSELIKLLQKYKDIVQYFKKSNLVMDKLKEEQVRKNKPLLRPIQSVITRWNSMFYMIKRLLDLNEDDYLTIVLASSPVLEPFEDVTNQLSDDSYVTVSLIIPAVAEINKKLLEVNLQTDVVKNASFKIK
ncbi:hypothetical protein ABEB36_003104 [Hypothenemus hampei]